MRNLILTLLLCCITHAAQAVTILEFELNNVVDSSDPFPASNYASNVETNSQLVLSGDLSGVVEPGYFLGNGVSTGSLNLSNSYFSFTITPTDGYQIQYSTLEYTWVNYSVSELTLALRSSHNGYASDLFNTTISDFTEHFYSTDISSLGTLSEAVTFRWYVYNASSPDMAGFIGPDQSGGNIALSGTISPVPESSSVLLLGIGAILLAKRRRKI